MRFTRNLLASWQSLSTRTHLSIGAGALIVLAVFIAFFYSRPSSSTDALETFETPNLPITMTSSYADGAHSIEGTVTLRNRCQRLDTIATLDDTQTPALIRIDVTSEHDEGICLEIPDTRTFTIEVEGPEDARLEVFVNGLPQTGDAL